MTLNQFTQAVFRQPFQPFSLILVGGRSFRVDHPEVVAIDRCGREVTFYASDNTQHFIDASLITEIVTSSTPEAAGT
jgi:hypothetical protein